MAPTAPLAEKQRALIAEAGKWLGVHESGGPNRGPEIEAFEKAIGFKPVGQAWCMVFVQFCIMQVDTAGGTPSWLHRSQGVLDVWNKSPMHARIQGLSVQPGDIMVWQHYDAEGKQTAMGHCGIVTKVTAPGKFETIEANTSRSEKIDRDGDGIFVKVRDIGGSSMMRVKGFLRAWSPSKG